VEIATNYLPNFFLNNANPWGSGTDDLEQGSLRSTIFGIIDFNAK